MKTIETIQKTQENYRDRDARHYMTLGGWERIKFTPKVAPVTEKNPEEAILIHVDAYDTVEATFVNFDVWPRANVTEAEKKQILEGKIKTFRWRFGRYVNEDTGEITLGEPKWAGIFFEAEDGKETAELFPETERKYVGPKN